ncbi:MAG: hypothetical protein WC714_29235 [Candidatus Obscuribacterales bacterium]
MANELYPLWKQELMKGNADCELDSAEGATGVFCALIDTGTYTYSAAHQFYSDLSGIVGTDQEILTKTQVLGVFDGTDLLYTALSGNSTEALVLYRKNAGANTTWPLICYLDTGIANLPFTPNGGNVTITWDAAGIFAL